MSKKFNYLDTYSSFASLTYRTKKDEVRRKFELPSRIDFYRNQFFIWQQNVCKKNKTVIQHRFIMSAKPMSICYKEYDKTFEIRESGLKVEVR